jgi:hypothetical protein
MARKQVVFEKTPMLLNQQFVILKIKFHLNASPPVQKLVSAAECHPTLVDNNYNFGSTDQFCMMGDLLNFIFLLSYSTPPCKPKSPLEARHNSPRLPTLWLWWSK